MGQFKKNSRGYSIGTAGFSERGKSSKDISSPSECSRASDSRGTNTSKRLQKKTSGRRGSTTTNGGA
jgi:hypothetical protein